MQKTIYILYIYITFVQSVFHDKHNIAWLVGQSRCRLSVGGFYKSLPLQGNWFGMAVNEADPPQGRANRVEVGRDKG